MTKMMISKSVFLGLAVVSASAMGATRIDHLSCPSSSAGRASVHEVLRGYSLAQGAHGGASDAFSSCAVVVDGRGDALKTIPVGVADAECSVDLCTKSSAIQSYLAKIDLQRKADADSLARFEREQQVAAQDASEKFEAFLKEQSAKAKKAAAEAAAFAKDQAAKAKQSVADEAAFEAHQAELAAKANRDLSTFEQEQADKVAKARAEFESQQIISGMEAHAKYAKFLARQSKAEKIAAVRDAVNEQAFTEGWTKSARDAEIAKRLAAAGLN